MEEVVHEVVIVGAGLAGLATAVALQRVGVKSLVLEKAEELRSEGAAIGIFPNAWHALQVLGVAYKFASTTHPVKTGYVTHIEPGKGAEPVIFVERNSDPVGARIIKRGALVQALSDELPKGVIRLSSKLVSMETDEVEEEGSCTTIHALRLSDGSVVRSKVVIGCDGCYSAIAKSLGLSAPVDSGRLGVRGIASFQEGHGFKDEFQQIQMLDVRAGFLPLNEHEIYYFIGHDAARRESKSRVPEVMLEEILDSIASDFPPKYQEIIRRTDLSTLSWYPLKYRSPWNVIYGPTSRGCVTVAGDAFHPMTPEIAQGGSAALEDAVVLARNLVQASSVPEGLQAYTRERRWRAAGIIMSTSLLRTVAHANTGWKLADIIVKIIFFRIILPPLLHVIWFYYCGSLP